MTSQAEQLRKHIIFNDMFLAYWTQYHLNKCTSDLSIKELCSTFYDLGLYIGEMNQILGVDTEKEDIEKYK